MLLGQASDSASQVTQGLPYKVQHIKEATPSQHLFGFACLHCTVPAQFLVSPPGLFTFRHRAQYS